MGWNDVSPMHHGDGAALIKGGEAYFLHSYHFAVEQGSDVAALTDHGGGLVAAVARDNILGVQFHPERARPMAWTCCPVSSPGSPEQGAGGGTARRLTLS
jgi:imidazoleglycerol phosphate synthase glutamine amidotransferase subunit HisH